MSVAPQRTPAAAAVIVAMVLLFAHLVIAISNDVCVTPTLHRFDFTHAESLTGVGGFLPLTESGEEGDVSFLRGMFDADSGEVVLQEVGANGTAFELVNPDIPLPQINSLDGDKALRRILRDGDGNFIFVGTYTVGLQRFMFVAKYSSTYAFIWIKTYEQVNTGSKITPFDAAIVSNANDIVVVGSTNHEFPGSGLGSLTLLNTGFILHLDSDGNAQWIFQETENDSPTTRVLCRDSGLCYIHAAVGTIARLRAYEMDTKIISMNCTVTTTVQQNAVALFFSSTPSEEGVGITYVELATRLYLRANFVFLNGTSLDLTDSVSLGTSTNPEVSAAHIDPNGNLYIFGFANYNFESAQASPSALGFVVKFNATSPVYRVNLGVSPSSANIFDALVIGENNLIISGSFTGSLFGEDASSAADAMLVRFQEDPLIYSSTCSKSCALSCAVSLNSTNITCDTGTDGRGLCICPPLYYGLSCENYHIPTPSPNATVAPTTPTDLPTEGGLPFWAIVVISCSAAIVFLGILVILALYFRKWYQYSPRMRNTRNPGTKYATTEVAIDPETNAPVQKTFVQASKPKRSKSGSSEQIAQVPLAPRRSDFDFPELPPATANYDRRNSTQVARPDSRRANATDRAPTYHHAMSDTSTPAPAYDEIFD